METDIDNAADGTDPCFEATTSDPKGNSVKGSGSVRTLKGFATSGAAKMSAEKWWNVYKNYWGDDNYADTYAQAALTGVDNAINKMAGKSDKMRGENVKKGIAYQAVWMYVLHEYEDAIMDCLAGDIFNNDAASSAGDSPHAWDEGWAFFAGSLEGVDGSGSGQLGFQLAEKRCIDFGTCTNGRSGAAIANNKALASAELGRDKILIGDCFTVVNEFDAIVDQMTVPLIQGMLKYAFKSDPANDQGSCVSAGENCDKARGEGWAFAAAVLPRLHFCDSDVAAKVRANLDNANANPMPDGFAALKAEVEKTYPCLGLTCADVGAFQNAAGVYTGMEACTDVAVVTDETVPADTDDHVKIAGYAPATNVVPHAKVDLDMKEIADAASAFDYTQAKFVYEKGGGGLCAQTDIDNAADGTDPCFEATTSDPKGNSVKGSGSVRTLKGFATSGAAKMSAEKWWNVYKNYWGDDNYGDTYAQAALTGVDNAINKMAGKSNKLKAENVKKGIAYQVVWMYVLHEYEDAIMDCLAGDIFNNDALNSAGDSPHAWDEGWAFFAGSLEGVDGSGSGQLGYQLAEKRCIDFGTCENGRTGAAIANNKALMNARVGRDKILAGDCFTVVNEFDAIVDQMTVPLIQGMLKYAFKSDPANAQGSCVSSGDNCDKAWGEGWAFAAAVLPRLHYCSSSVATTVRTNLDNANANPMPDGFAAVKAAVETTYGCLGITCAEVGAIQNAAGVYTGMDACSDASTNADGYESWTAASTAPPATTVAAVTTVAAGPEVTTAAAAAAVTTAAPASIESTESMAASLTLAAIVFSM